MTKRRRTARPRAQVAEQRDYLSEDFGISAPDEEGSEDEENVDAPAELAEVAEPESTEAEREPAEPTAEPSEPLESAEEGETEAPPSEDAAAAERERLKHEKGLRDEITRLRTELQQLRATEARTQAPPPQLSQQPTSTDTGYSAADLATGDRGKILWSEDGTPYYDRGEIRRMVAEQVRQQTQPDPIQQLDTAITNARRDWVAENPASHAPAAQRVEQAADFINLLSEHYCKSTGHVPTSFREWIDTLENSGVADKFRTSFPEIQNIGPFIDAFFVGQDPDYRVWKMRNYMQDYVARSDQFEPTQETEEVQEVAARGGTNIVSLSRSKPRSMAEKGRGSAKMMGDKEKLDKLLEEQGADPFTFPEEDKAELQRLAKKLRIEI